MKLQVVVGAQFGSEAKGHVTHQLIQRAINNGESVVNIRVAGPNAGHCVVDNEGTKWAMRQVPVGFATTTQRVLLVIGPGSEIDLPVLLDEIDRTTAKGHRTAIRLLVDQEATLLTDRHKSMEANAALSKEIGSTGKGIGACRADRLMRKAQRVRDSDEALWELARRGVTVADSVRFIRSLDDATVIIEGTQGYGLGLHAGHYPQCTSSDARAIDFCAMAGLSPWEHRFKDEFEVWAVARVYPIRVAGNSGPLKGETTWEQLGLAAEHTTVTQKVRRVGAWDGDLVAKAVEANGGSPTVRLALTMVDQKIPGVANIDDWDAIELNDQFAVLDLIEQVDVDARAEIGLITTGPSTAIWGESRW